MFETTLLFIERKFLLLTTVSIHACFHYPTVESNGIKHSSENVTFTKPEPRHTSYVTLENVG
jgi:hypothetical protein